MGNTVAPCMCHKDDAGTAAVTTTRGRRRAKSSSKQQQQDENETTRAGQPERSRARARAGGVSWAGGRVGADDDDADAVSKQASAVVTVKIVLKRKDAEALVARLNAQSARERKARMDELKGELFRAGDWGGVGGASPTRSPCRDAWKPSLVAIKEN